MDPCRNKEPENQMILQNCHENLYQLNKGIDFKVKQCMGKCIVKPKTRGHQQRSRVKNNMAWMM